MASSLPLDVLVELFRALPEPETQFVHGLFDVASVNKAWRNAALGCGQLWSCIRTEKKRDRRLVPLLLERSRTAPLDVRLDMFCSMYGSTPPHDVTPEERAALVQTLLPHVHRIRKLFVRHGILEPESEDETTILRLFNAGLEFTALEEYTHEHRGQGFQPSPESDTPLSLTALNLRSLSIDGIRPRAWSALVARSLVELDIASKGTPFDMDLLSMIFQQCRDLASLKLRREFFHNHPVLAAPAPHLRTVPPPSLRALDLYMPMPEILAVLSLFSSGSPLPAITICDGDGLRSMTLPPPASTTPQPILVHMLRDLAPLVAFEVHGDQDIVLRDAAGRTRRFCVDEEDDACYDTAALWAFLVQVHGAHRTVRTLLGRMAAWSWLTRALERQQPEPASAHDGGVELQMGVECGLSLERFKEYCDAERYAPLHLAALRKLTVHPAKYTTTCTVEGVLHLLGMVRPARRGVEVCLGEVVLDVPPRRYCAEFQKLVQGMARVGPEALWAEEGPEGVGQWVACAHCVARAEEIGRKEQWCVHCRTSENEKWREYCDDRWHFGWP